MDATSSLRLGEYLLQQQQISEQDLEQALEFQQHYGGRLGAIFVRLGALSEELLLQALSQALQLPVLSPEQCPFDSSPLLELIEQSQIDKDWWLDQAVLAWHNEADELLIIARDVLDDSVQEILEKTFPSTNLNWHLARTQDLDRLLDMLEKSQQDSNFYGDEVGQLRELAEGAPVVEFVNNLFSQAIDQNVSDVHIEPEEHHFHARYRRDGVLQIHLSLPIARFAAIASRIKLIAGLDIAERRLPQDGRMNLRVSGQSLDVRVSTLPGVHGESIVMRLLPKDRDSNHLDKLGFAPDHYRLFTEWVAEPHGIILVTGPTGSGKSTTLYSTLDHINDRSQKIITVEDPVEFQLPHITQVQTHSEIGYTFAQALRSILRQDPDVVMIGEIRDLETAEIAIQASLTGHMVLSTLHTNDAVSAFTRLLDMGVEPFLVATSVRAVQAQRLVRVLCKACQQPTDILPEMAAQIKAILPDEFKHSPATWRKAVGCPACQNTGYQGRIGIYELVYISPEMQSLILKRASGGSMSALAQQQGFRTLRQDGWIKAWQGITTLEEVMRVTES